MLAILSSTGRVLWRHWPALLLWFIAGITARHFIIQVAGTVGGHSATLGMLILPLGVLARLVSFVGMFLVVRDALQNLQVIAPDAETGRERRTMFMSSLLTSILPFFAVYAAAGNLKEDAAEYARIALDVDRGIDLQRAVDGLALTDADVGTTVSLGPTTALIALVAFAGRWAWKKYSAKLPSPFAVVAVYLEVVWVAFAVALIGDATSALTSWMDHRVAVVWLTDIREWVSGSLTPVAWIWDGIEWLLGAAGGIILQPLAWLMIAGVIYGQTIVAEKLTIENQLIARARARAERVPSALRRRAGDLRDELTARFKPIGRAILLMWRAGPVMIASYVLLYTIVLALKPLLEWSIVSLIGPQEPRLWWTVGTLITMAPLVLAEPVRIALVSGAYDRTLKATRRAVENAPQSAALLPGDEPAPEAADAQDGSITNLTNSSDPSEPGPRAS
ncbi:hypothetical protein ACFVAE_13860 [Microbacterium sp. NPDC057659]|uniref:hypothetical protein n=1 Tax=Microbacterium sp. NPDC057659 TaxID=3346198 RepID=UPI003672DAAD